MATSNFFTDQMRTVTLEHVYQGLEKPAASELKANSLIWDRQNKAWYTNPSGSWVPATFSGSTFTLNSFTDVNTSGVTDGQALGYDSSTSTWKPYTFGTGSASSLNNLTDVSIPGPSDNDILYYDASTSSWRVQAFSTQEAYSSVSDLTTALGSMAAKDTVSTSDFSDFDADVKDVTEAVEFNAQTGTSYTFVLSDAGKLVSFDNTSAITVTVPPASSVGFDVGTVIGLVRENTGTVTFQAGAGVTIRSKSGNLSINGQWGTAALTYLDGDVWLLSGDLA